MRVKILGCGPSFGVPSLSRGFGECDPINPKNRRMRSSILVQDKGVSVLIDSGPEIRLQLLGAGRPDLDAVLYTHSHYDHMGGADDLRAALNENQETLPVYLSEADTAHFKNLLDYMFQPHTKGKVVFDVHTIQPFKPFRVGDLEILPILQQHGSGDSMGYRIGDFAYSTDVADMDEDSFTALKGVKVWLLGVVTTLSDTNKHLNVDRALEWINRIQPERAYFTHMGTRMDYDTLCHRLPLHIRPVYDGLELDI